MTVAWPHQNWERQGLDEVEALEWVIETHEMWEHRIPLAENSVVRQGLRRAAQVAS